MEIREAVNELAKMIGDKAGEMVELGKLNAKLYSEKNALDELKKQIGEVCFGKYRSGEELDPEIESLCAKLEQHQHTVSETKRMISRMKATSQPQPEEKDAYCPYCGEALVKSAAFCSSCGEKIR